MGYIDGTVFMDQKLESGDLAPVRRAPRPLGAAGPIACPDCRRFAGTERLFAAIRGVLHKQDPVEARNRFRDRALKANGWPNLRGYGRSVEYDAELQWALRRGALSSIPPHGREFPASRAALHQLMQYTLWWLEHLPRNYLRASEHLAGAPDWMQEMACGVGSVTAKRWRLDRVSAARRAVAIALDPLDLEPGTLRRLLQDRAQIKGDYELANEQIIESFATGYEAAHGTARNAIVEASPFEECTADEALFGVRGTTASFRLRSLVDRARFRVRLQPGFGGMPDSYRLTFVEPRKER